MSISIRCSREFHYRENSLLVLTSNWLIFKKFPFAAGQNRGRQIADLETILHFNGVKFNQCKTLEGLSEGMEKKWVPP